MARLDLVEQAACVRLKPVVLLRGAGTFTNPAGDSDWLSTSATGEQTHFDSSGKQTWLVSADGLSTTTFTYSCGDLSGIETPDGAVTTSMLSSG